METRKRADINQRQGRNSQAQSGGMWQQGCWDSSWLNPLVLLEVSVALQWQFVCFLFPVSVFGEHGKRHLRSRFPALKSDLNVFVSAWLSGANGDMIYTRSHTSTYSPGCSQSWHSDGLINPLLISVYLLWMCCEVIK